MRILLDGKQVDSLDAKIVRRLGPLASQPRVEGVVVSADQIIATTDRRLKTTFGIVGGISVAVMTVAVVMAIGYEPAVMVVVGPVYLVILAALAWLFSFAYRRGMARMRDKTASRLARIAPPGTAIHLDGAGLTLARQTTPWSEIALDAVEIVTVTVSEGPDDYSIEAVLLDVRGGSVVMDEGVITNGPAIVATTLQALGAPWLTAGR